MLARLWLRLGAFVGKTLLWLLGLGLLGWVLATAWFAWQQAHPGEGLAWWIGRLSVAIVQRRLLQDAPPR